EDFTGFNHRQASGGSWRGARVRQLTHVSGSVESISMSVLDEIRISPHHDRTEGVTPVLPSIRVRAKQETDPVDLKRVIDIAGASVALVFFAPIMMIIFIILM